jgi:hypothetical protein
MVTLAFILATMLWLALDRRCRSRRLVPPLLLFAAAVASSAAATYLSVRSQYFVFERQWVAGMALAAIALTWFFGEWWRNVRHRPRILAAPVVVYLGLVVVSFTISVATQAGLTASRAELRTVVEQETRSVSELIAHGQEETFSYEPRQGFEYMADVNIARGGPVWEEFVRWYNKEAGMRAEYREADVNWTDSIWPEPAPQSYLCLPGYEWQCPTP